MSCWHALCLRQTNETTLITKTIISMKTNLFLMAAAMTAALTLGACNDDSRVVDMSKPIDLTFRTADVQSRATVGVNNSAFEEGDRVGVYLSSTTLDGAEYRNVEFTAATNNRWTSTPMYWPSGMDTYTLTAYYPYADAPGAVSLPADQSTAEAYTGADYMWGQVTGLLATDEPVAVTLNHKMGLVKLNIKPGDGITLADIHAMRPAIVGSIPAAGTWNLATGDIAAATEGSIKDIRPYEAYVENTSLTYYALVMPGTKFAVGERFFTLTDTDGTTFYYELNVTGGIEAVAGSYCDITLTVNRTGITLDSFTIGSWTPGQTGSGSVEMEI